MSATSNHGARPLLLFWLALASLSAPTSARAQTLGQALDAPLLDWTSGGSRGIEWIYQPEDLFFGTRTFDGVDTAETNPIGDNEQTWVQTTVTGPGYVSFWWYAFSEPDMDWLTFEIDATEMARLSGTRGTLSATPSGWQYRKFPVPAGPHTLRWMYAKNGEFTGGSEDVARLDQVRFVNWPEPGIAETMAACGVAWESGGNTNETFWFGQTNVTRDGLALQSGQVGHNQTNWVEATVVNATNVVFWWKVSSETNADWLILYTNGIFAKKISGEVNWQSNHFRLRPNGTNVLRWIFGRDDSVTAGQNCAWLDQLAFNPVKKAGPYTLSSARLPDGSVQLTLAGDPGCPCQIRVSTNLLQGWEPWTNLTTTGNHTRIVDPAPTNVPARFYRALSL